MCKCVYGGYDSRGENSVCAWRVWVVVCLVKSEKMHMLPFAVSPDVR